MSVSADQIEAHFKKLILDRQCETVQLEFLENWIKKQPHGKPIDSDLLALRTLETLILLAIVNFQRVAESQEAAAFKALKDELMDWSEAAGLIRSLSDNQLSSVADITMDLDFDPNSESSTLFALKPTEFDIYLLEKFKGKQRGGVRMFKEIVEILADRCGIPVDSDFEELPLVEGKEPAKHVSLGSSIMYYNTLL